MFTGNLLRFASIVVFTLCPSIFVYGMTPKQDFTEIKNEYRINTIFDFIRRINDFKMNNPSKNDFDVFFQNNFMTNLNIDTVRFTVGFRSNAFIYYLESQGIILEKGNNLIKNTFNLDGLLLCQKILNKDQEENLVSDFAHFLQIFKTLKSPTEDKTKVRDEPFVKYLIPTVVNKNDLTFLAKDMSLYLFFYHLGLFFDSTKDNAE